MLIGHHLQMTDIVSVGNCFSLNRAGPLISWKSQKQSTVALSSCEAEYIALAAAVQEGMYLTQMMKYIGEF